MIEAVAHVVRMSPYALAALKAPPGKRLISLSQNESLRPPSPHAIEAATQALRSGNLYPDPEWSELTAALAELHGIPAGQILCGSGSMELITCLTKAFADEQDRVLAPAHAYPFFKTAAALARAGFDTAPEADGTVSVDALLDAMRPDTRIVFVANPGNPTGTRISRQDLLLLRDGLPEDTLLVIDEAYGEFADHLHEPMFDLIDRGNTVVLRTFSKAYGLAAMRVGWGLFPPAIAAEIRKVMNPNNVSAAAQSAATAAVQDQAFMLETCAITSTRRDAFISRLRSAGFKVADSFTNFALVRFGTADAAKSADAALQSEGVIARAQAGAGLPSCLRFTIGSEDALDLVARHLERWVQEQNA